MSSSSTVAIGLSIRFNSCSLPPGCLAEPLEGAARWRQSDHHMRLLRDTSRHTVGSAVIPSSHYRPTTHPCTSSVLHQLPIECCKGMAPCSPTYGMASCLASYGILNFNRHIRCCVCQVMRAIGTAACPKLSLPNQHTRDLRYGHRRPRTTTCRYGPCGQR